MRNTTILYCTILYYDVPYTVLVSVTCLEESLWWSFREVQTCRHVLQACLPPAGNTSRWYQVGPCMHLVILYYVYAQGKGLNPATPACGIQRSTMTPQSLQLKSTLFGRLLVLLCYCRNIHTTWHNPNRYPVLHT